MVDRVSTDHPNDATSAASEHDSVLPEYWETPAPPAPVRPRRIPWPIAVLVAPLFWLMPKRMGVHFAEAGGLAALVAHVVWTLYGIGCIIMAVELNAYNWVNYLTNEAPGQQHPMPSPMAPTFSGTVRAPLASLVNELSRINRFDDLVAGIGIVAGVESGLVALAISLMAYAAAGERAGRLFVRCLRLTLWCTTSLVVLGLVLQAIPRHLGNLPPRVVFCVSVLYAGWFAWLWIRSGSRYGGPATGPGWARRSPRCARCGYALTGLPCDPSVDVEAFGYDVVHPPGVARCPECGLPLAESLPKSRRLPHFATAQSMPRRIPAFFRTFGDALAGHGFFRRLPVHSGYADARQFAVWTCLLCGALSGVSLLVSQILLPVLPLDQFPMPETSRTVNVLAVAGAGAILVTISIVIVLGLVGALMAALSLSPIRRGAILAFYSAPWVVLIVFAYLIAHEASASIMRQPSLFTIEHLWPFARYRRFLPHLFFVPVLFLLPAWPTRLYRAVRQTRFANA